MKPIIGIIPTLEEGKYQVKKKYIDAVEHVGGIPLILSYLSTPEGIEEYIRMIDGLLLIGGIDVDPGRYNEEPVPELGLVIPERDEFEIVFLHLFIKTNKPVFGICRGLQLVNVALGGTLFQDIPTQFYSDNKIQHQQKSGGDHSTHFLTLAEDSQLYAIIQLKSFRVNSFHHQSIKALGKDLRSVAWTKDGIIEAIEKPNHSFCICVQWHPEESFKEEHHVRLFSAFIKACVS